MTSDDRMTWGLILEVLDVLERHGYHQHDHQHTGEAIGLISDLTHVYEGARDAPYGTYLDQAVAPETRPPALLPGAEGADEAGVVSADGVG